MKNEIEKIMNEWNADQDGNWADLMPAGTHVDEDLADDSDYLCSSDETGENFFITYDGRVVVL